MGWKAHWSIIENWIAHDVMKAKPPRRHIGIPHCSHTFHWINRKSYAFNEKTSPNKSAFLNLKYPCAFLQCKHPRHVNGYFFNVGNFPCLLKSYVHIHYSSEHQMNMINIRRTRPQHIYNKWQSAHSEIWRNIYALYTHTFALYSYSLFIILL